MNPESIGSTLTESFKLAPALTALVVIVYLFIRAQQWLIKHHHEASTERAAMFANTVKEMHDEHIEARRATREMIDKNAESNLQLVRVMTEVQSVMRHRQFSQGE